MIRQQRGECTHLCCDLLFYMLQYLVVKKMKNSTKKNYDISVLGGGASGMMAAICAARVGASVVLLECNDSLGRKLLATGNGKCNFTNKYMKPACYFSQAPDFVETALGLFSEKDTVSFFRELGVLSTEREGYFYPRSQQAKTIRNALERELDRLNVAVLLSARVRDVKKDKDVFEIKYGDDVLEASKVIMAMGGKASDIKGSNGDGYYYATKMGHTLVPLVPALVQLHTNHPDMDQIAGVRCDSILSLYCNNQLLDTQRGELQLTKQGLSGIVTFQLSRMAAYGLQEGKNVDIKVDFLPEISEQRLEQWIEDSSVSGMTIGQTLLGMFHEKLVPLVLKTAKIYGDMSPKNMSKKQMSRLIQSIKAHEFQITDTHGFKSAQVTGGGISTKEINPKTMESLIIPGLYITGEIMDVDGICGGYNLQWAWTSGALAGKDAAKDSI